MPTNVFFNLKEKKKESIIKALIDEFSQFSLEEVQVKRIVESCNIARGSFYQYFSDNNDAFKYTLRIMRANIIEANLSLLNHNSEDNLLEIVRNYFLENLNEAFGHKVLHNESKMLQQIRKSPKAIEIFINEFGKLDQFEEQISKIEGVSKKEDKLLSEIMFPTLKLTIEKLLKKEINIKQANEEMNMKLDIISQGYHNIRK
jgi:AcrR family transcriptional regulator